MLIESPFPPLFPPFPPVGRRVGIPHFWAWVPWMGYGVECVREWLEGLRGSPGRVSAPQGFQGVRSIGIEREISFLSSSSSSPFPSSLSPLSLPHTTTHHTKVPSAQQETSTPLTILLSSSKAVCSPPSHLPCCVSHSRFIPDVCSMDSKTTLTHSMVSS